MRNDANRGVDIRSVRVVNEDRIRVRTTFDRLQRSGSTSLSVHFDVNRRNRGPSTRRSVDCSKGRTGRRSEWTGGATGGRTLLLHCAIDLRTKYGRSGTATYDIARRCFGRPDRIRVAARSGGPGPDDWAPRRTTFYWGVDHR